MGHRHDKGSAKNHRRDAPSSGRRDDTQLPTVFGFGSGRHQTALDDSDRQQMTQGSSQPYDAPSETVRPAWSNCADDGTDMMDGAESASSNARGYGPRGFELPRDQYFGPGYVVEHAGGWASQMDASNYTNKEERHERSGNAKGKHNNRTGFSGQGSKNVDEDPRHRDEFRYQDVNGTGSQFGYQQTTTGTSSWIDDMPLPGPYENCIHGFPRYRCPYSVCQRGLY